MQVSAPQLLWVALAQSSAEVAQPARLEQQLPALVLNDCADRLRDATAHVLTERPHGLLQVAGRFFQQDQLLRGQPPLVLGPHPQHAGQAHPGAFDPEQPTRQIGNAAPRVRVDAIEGLELRSSWSASAARRA